MAPKAQKTALAGRLIESHTRIHCREGTSATRGRLLLDPKRFSGRSLCARLAELMRKTGHKVTAVAVGDVRPFNS